MRRRLWGGALLLVALATSVAARESEWGSVPRATTSLSTMLRSRSNDSSMGLRRGSLQGLASTCTLAPTDSAVGRAAAAALKSTGCVELPGAPLAWGVSIHATDPACYTPLYKAHRVPFAAAVTLGVLDAAGAFAGELNVAGDVTVQAIGFLSCRAFREHVGREIGYRVANEMRGFRDAVK